MSFKTDESLAMNKRQRQMLPDSELPVAPRTNIPSSGRTRRCFSHLRNVDRWKIVNVLRISVHDHPFVRQYDDDCPPQDLCIEPQAVSINVLDIEFQSS